MTDIADAPEIIFPRLGIVIQHLDRTAFALFGMEIRWYGILMALGVLAGLAYVVREAKRLGDNPDLHYDFLFFAVISGIVCARIYYVAFSWDMYKDDLPSILDIRSGGIAMYGSIIGALICAVVYTRAKKVNFWRFADIYAPGLTIGQIIGRWGNFVNREAFGGFSDGPFSIMYLKSQVNSANITEEIAERAVILNGAKYIQVHPTFLYESLWNLGLLIFLLWFRKRKRFDGEVFAAYFTGYALGRVWIEGLRTDQLLIGGIPVSQALSAVLIVAGIVFIARNRMKLKKTSA